MLDFKELPVDGDRFELMIREILYKKGMEVYWSGKGQDGGKDLLCIEKSSSVFKPSEKRWLIQCKHNAHSGKSVGTSDLDDIVDSCAQHDASGYLLVCSTFPSSTVVKRLEGIQNHSKIATSFWDNCILERELMKPINWSLLNEFLPNSSKMLGWQINSLDNNFWYANYNSNTFYISLRIGTNCNIHLSDIAMRVNEIQQVVLPEGHYMRLRGVYFDDKYWNYLLFIDYLVPHDTECNKLEVNEEVYTLLSDRVIDGVYHSIDLNVYAYNPYSDNFDKDHQEYYNRYISNFKTGFERHKDNRFCIIQKDDVRKLTEETTNEAFELFIESLHKIPFISILNSQNAKVEFIDQFPENSTWKTVIEDTEHRINNFFNVDIRFTCDDFETLKAFLNTFEQDVVHHFELSKNYVFLPHDGFCEEDENIYTLKIYVHPGYVTSKLTFRIILNQYLTKLKKAVDLYITQNL